MRSAVIQNLKEMTQQELDDMVKESVDNSEEKILPGLGVVFELIWKNSDSSEQEKMIASLKNELEKS